MTGALSPTHWIVILVVVLLLFGAKRLPDAARGVGKSLRIFKAETAALSSENEKADPTAGAPAQSAATDPEGVSEAPVVLPSSATADSSSPARHPADAPTPR